MFATVVAMAFSASSAQQPAAAAPAPAQQQAAQQTEGYTCPITGEVLPCPNCCPLKK